MQLYFLSEHTTQQVNVALEGAAERLVGVAAKAGMAGYFSRCLPDRDIRGKSFLPGTHI